MIKELYEFLNERVGLPDGDYRFLRNRFSVTSFILQDLSTDFVWVDSFSEHLLMGLRRNVGPREFSYCLCEFMGSYDLKRVMRFPRSGGFHLFENPLESVAVNPTLSSTDLLLTLNFLPGSSLRYSEDRICPVAS